VSDARIRQYVRSLCDLPGACAAALVDRGSGMVWAQAGELPDFERLSEAAIEFWRLHERASSNLASLGTPESITITCSRLTLSLRPAPEFVANDGLVTVVVLDWHAPAERRASSE
jgi:hypothetical protein